MRRLIICLTLCSFCLSAPSAFGSDGAHKRGALPTKPLSKASAKLEQFKKQQAKESEIKSSQEMVTLVIDVINEEIAPFPKVRPAVNKALQKARITCNQKITSSQCITDMEAAYDLAVQLVEKEIAAKNAKK